MKNLPIEWLGNSVRLIDQTRLPREEVYITTSDYREVAQAIKKLQIRGAPAIGVAAAYGVALGALEISAESCDEFFAKLDEVIQTIEATRPTARNLFMATKRMRDAAFGGRISKIKDALVREAVAIHAQEAEATRLIAEFGSELIKDGFTILTHCNTGPLATSGYGTALGVIIRAHEQGKRIKVFATETRPLLQGARLTAWELKRAGIPFTLITDSMAGHFMKTAGIDCVIVGADRIAANGDTANKIGTYSLAVLAHEHGIPFYIAAPITTIDPEIASGEGIVIEERSPEEVTRFRGQPTCPEGIKAANPSFDVTPHRYIAAIITDKGIIREPYGEGIRGVVE